MNPYEHEMACRREAYIMAKTSPWHLWAALAIRAGYIPPLIPGTIPPDIPRVLPVAALLGRMGSSPSLMSLQQPAPADCYLLRIAKSALGVFFLLVSVVCISLIIRALEAGDGFQIALLSRFGY